MKKLVAGLLVLVVAVGIACSRNAGAPAPATLGAFTPGQIGPFVIPASWKQATWFVDPANVSTCASDNNRTCSASACTAGDGPCLTYGSIATRWGTYSPRVQQNTAITLMSSASTDADVWYMGPFGLELGAGVIVQGTLTTIQTTTLSAVTAKSRATNQALLATFTASAGITVGMLVVNTTHPSVAWTYKSLGGGQFMMTQPGNAINETNPTLKSCLNPGEVDTWAPTDAVTVSSVPVANFATGSADIQGESSSSFANGLIFYRVGVRVPSSTAGFAPFAMGGGMQFVESASGSRSSQRQEVVPASPSTAGSILPSRAG